MPTCVRATAETMPWVTVWPTRERIADREHHVADLQRVGIAEVDAPGIARSASLMRSTARSVRASFSTISASNSRLSASATFTSVGAFDDVVVGHHQAAGVDDTPEPSERCTCCGRPPAPAAEEAAEERILEERIAVRRPSWRRRR